MMRLAKKLAESGVASRRVAEQLIAEGRVCVDGVPVLTPVCFVDENNLVTVDGWPIPKRSDEVIVWKFYKPRGVITTRTDPKGRTTVYDIIREKLPDLRDRLIYIGRLDYNSEGLLLFTNNGDFARKMELPSSKIPRTYRVRVLGNITRKQVEQMQKGVTIEGVHYGSMQAEIISNHGNSAANTWLTISLYEGKNREIRKVMEYFNCTVNRLIRVAYGDVKVGDLRPGEIKKIDGYKVSH